VAAGPVVRVAGGRRPAVAHLRQSSRSARSCTKVVGGCFIAARSTSLGVLHRSQRIQPREAAEALKPVAGAFAECIFALGIVGTGLLAIPVLAGSTAYAIGEGRRWPVGLSRKPKEAVAFYAVLARSVALGVVINFTGVDPIKALYWSAVINGVMAAPVMAIMMLLVRRKSVMGDLVVKGPVDWLGWIATAAMAFCIAAMGISFTAS
jgi:Mn2+/Fe2+ NRAMP family transporter